MRTPSKVFLDTNILVYAADSADRQKQARAMEVVREIRKEGIGVISTQVMQEFFVVAVRKLGLALLDARKLTLTLSEFEVVSMTPTLVEQAMDLTILYQLSFWDALLVAAAKEGRCAKLLSEDLQTGQTIAGIKIENPI